VLAYTLGVHKNPEQVHRLLHSIYSPDDLYYINIFGVDSLAKRSLWEDRLATFKESNVFLAFKDSNAWGTIDQVNATLDSMKYFSGLEYSHFINLSGQCYPIIPINKIKDFFSKTKSSFIAYDKMPAYSAYEKIKNLTYPPNTAYHERFAYHYYPVLSKGPMKFIKAFLRVRKDTNLFVRIPRIKKDLLRSIELFKGSNWFCLHKFHVDYILEYIHKNPEYSRLFSTVHCSDEHFFHIILLNSPFRSEIVNDNLRYIVWDRFGAAPEILRVENFNEIVNSGKFFARKFDITVDSEILDLIDINNKKSSPK